MICDYFVNVLDCPGLNGFLVNSSYALSKFECLKFISEPVHTSVISYRCSPRVILLLASVLLEASSSLIGGKAKKVTSCLISVCCSFILFFLCTPPRISGPVGNRTRISSVQVKYPTIELQAHCYEPFSLVLNFVLTEES